MKNIKLTAQKDHIQQQTSASPMQAVAELVWNGLDAGANRVEILFDQNGIAGIDTIRVRDGGLGIDPDEVEQLFGNLGDSWKRDNGRAHNRSLHGKNGKGRLKAFALGELVEWKTVFRKPNGDVVEYQVRGNADALDEFVSTAPVKSDLLATGTEVVISNLKRELPSLLKEDSLANFTKVFAAYLNQYPDIAIEYDGAPVRPALVQKAMDSFSLKEIELPGGRNVDATLSIVEWNFKMPRSIQLCDSSGVALHEIEPGIRPGDFSFTAYVKSDHFRELDKENLLTLADMHADVDAILKVARKEMKDHFRKKKAAQHAGIVEKWKLEQIYPYEEKKSLTPVETAERQVFDIVAVNLEDYLPDFDKAEPKARKFTFMLLAQALKQNPESLQRILTEVLGLKPEDQATLAELLTKMPISAIISSAKLVANRLDFLVGLENLIFDKETKGKLLERDQLHKILETESWVFDEDFALSASEQRLEEVLEKHIGKLRPKSDGEMDVLLPDGKTGRVDLMLKRAIQPRVGHHDYLVVELKRPTKKIDDEVITQVKKYAMAVAGDERFNGVPATWTFVAISNEMNEYARKDSSQPGKPRGEVYSDGNVRVIVREWADVINEARARLQFVNKTLSYEADRDSAKNYLKKAHEKYIPVESHESDSETESTVPAKEAVR